ncbi:growth arrest and DNA damage-inducible protein GADD45 gamma-like [Ruditapes philippinarum]|uniref:growth arrest and DNA damage-inducible protein GADD45 gamma-like n=1 Tax=Ruditapes philippinarum TaxID=129788 RepID=UPI00295AE495|nr:growth arrest and DNA damage-inducible protein GADD45 gamma-like [Ruditapes philippinarum]
MDKIITMKDYRRNISVDSDTDMSGDECTETFQDLIYIANKEGRLVKGVFEAAHVLELCSDIVKLCILPSGPSRNISTHIQHKLIEAYCLENDIKIIEINDFNSMCIHRNKTIDTNGIDCALVTSKSFQEEVEANQNEYKDNSG